METSNGSLNKKSGTPTGLIYNEYMLKHTVSTFHPEQPRRLTAIRDKLLKEPVYNQLKSISATKADKDYLTYVHDPGYVERVSEISSSGGGWLDADTYVSKDSYQAALYASGSVILSVDLLHKGEIDSSFCLVRPPGHHATRGQGMGFCLFNNLSIGARYAQKAYSISKIMIVDWDAHHGNGIQDIFASDSNVLYISLHQYPHYPGTGSLDEIGSGEGKGFTINIPFAPGAGDACYLQAFDEIIVPVGRQFKPELLMIAAGYDGHEDDPLASLDLTETGYSIMTVKLVEIANQFCSGRLIASLEGGYNLDSLASSACVTIKDMAYQKPFQENSHPGLKNLKQPSDKNKRVLEEVLNLVKQYWRV